ncbi:MAG: hypothetical protein KAX46_06870 [Chromatiaceae bacterium]|nr:hypothetical protein [Chromatiaceae bacterium]
MDQLDLMLERPVITGQAALPMMSKESMRRLMARGLVKRGVPFYLLANRAGDIRMWAGRGQVPGWVREWEHGGNDLNELKAVL